MDIRLEVLRIDGVWTVTSRDPQLTRCDSEPEAIHAAIEAARLHHAQTGGEASVHLWRGAEETTIFDTGANRQKSV